MSETRDDLRQRVDELEATVRGLTQELVEANERVRQLEEELDARPETIVAEGAGEADEPEEPSQPMGTEMETEPGPAPESESDTGTEDTEEEGSDDIIVA